MTIHLPPRLESPILAAVHSGRYASLDDAMTEAASMLVERLRQEQPPSGQNQASRREANLGRHSRDDCRCPGRRMGQASPRPRRAARPLHLWCAQAADLMRLVFADTLYWVAITHRKDQWHQAAVKISRTLMDASWLRPMKCWSRY